MKVELSRFRVKQDKSARVDQWLEMLNNNMSEVLQTLDRENMKVEVIFREIIDGEEYLYWFSIQGEDGASIQSSPFAIDHQHIQFQDECIDHDYGRHDAQSQVIMVPQKIAQAMDWSDPQISIAPFQRREIIRKRDKQLSDRLDQ